MKWFIYCGMEFYPFYDIIEADTAEEAADAFGLGDDPIAVFPLDALAYRHAGQERDDNWPS